MDAVFLALYVAIPVVAWWKTRSIAWVVLAVAMACAVLGAVVGGLIDLGVDFSQLTLQVLLLAALGAVLLASWVRPWKGRVGAGHQALAVLVPVGLLLLLLALVTVVWSDGLAFTRPVGYLIGQGTAEDNSRWLDFASQWATGDPISQSVPLGGPLQVYLTFVGTAMAVYSQVLFGGVNEVAVAANTVIFGQYLLVAAMPLAFAVMVESRFAASMGTAPAEARSRGLIPAPLVWSGALVLSVASLAVVAFGHLTLQFSFLAIGLWVATFLSPTRIPRARLVTSLVAAASMTVWLPLSVIAVAVIGGWGCVYVIRGFRDGVRSIDWFGAGLIVVIGLGVAQPLISGFSFVFLDSAASMNLGGLGASVGGGGVSNLVSSLLLTADGGTEQAGPVLVLLAGAAAVAASVVVSRQPSRTPGRVYRSFAPLGALVAVAVAIYGLDFWGSTGGPHYGSLKFGFLVVVIALAACLPISLLLLDGQSVTGMTASRWVGIASVVLALTADTLLPRALGQARPELWSPPIPYNNTSGSYWYPAEVNGEPNQLIEANPIACVYLPTGYQAPTAIVPSGLSDPQRVYACTRQLAGLGGLDTQAQDVVAWLRREWLTNTPAWSDVYDGLAGLPAEVLDRPVILLDDGSNVTGVETLRSLLSRYPKDAALVG